MNTSSVNLLVRYLDQGLADQAPHLTATLDVQAGDAYSNGVIGPFAQLKCVGALVSHIR